MLVHKRVQLRQQVGGLLLKLKIHPFSLHPVHRQGRCCLRRCSGNLSIQRVKVELLSDMSG
jgi:hypothetical protein